MTFHPMVPLPVLVGLLLFGAAVMVWRRIRRPSTTGILRSARRLLMLVLLCLVVARPGVLAAGAPVRAPAADIFFVVDTTASMSAEDGPDAAPRLAGVQRDITALVGELAGADFAMITFDSVVSVRVPLTHDAAAVITATTTLRPEVSARSKGSSIGAAAETLRAQLEAAAAAHPHRARAVYYFGDGEQTVSTSVEPFTGSAALIGGGAVLGYGTADGGIMRVHSGGTPNDSEAMILDPRTGEAAVSTADEKTLKAIAADLGLDYRHRDSVSTVSLAGDLALSVVQRDGSVDRTSTTEFYWVPALALFPFLALETGVAILALSRTRPGRSRR